MKTKQRESASPEAKAAAGGDAGSIHLDKPIYTLSVASEILETHPRTLMMYEHQRPRVRLQDLRQIGRAHV